MSNDFVARRFDGGDGIVSLERRRGVEDFIQRQAIRLILE
jgi:hypothetical protein